MSTSSSQKLYVTFVVGEVVIGTFGGAVGSRSEKYDANWSESMSADVSGTMDTPFTSVVLGSLKPSAD